MIKIAPSILAADPLHLGQAARLAREACADELHFDVMDGQFVPNLTFGPHILAAIKRQEPDLYSDVHLMLAKPGLMVDSFAGAGADGITLHAEAEGWLEALDHIRARGLKAGVSLRPHTPVDVLAPHLDRFERVLLMTVEPGFGGQRLMPEVLEKAPALRAMGYLGDIEADGGIDPQNMALLAQKGVQILVMGTAFFKSGDPRALARRVHALPAFSAT